MDQLRVDTDTAYYTSHSVSNDADELREELEGLQRNWDNLSRGWTGVASSAYSTIWAEWLRAPTSSWRRSLTRHTSLALPSGEAATAHRAHRNYTDAAQANLDMLTTRVDGQTVALHGTWSGEAADAHRATHDEWMAGATQMREAMADLGEAAYNAHRNYTDAAQANLDMLT